MKRLTYILLLLTAVTTLNALASVSTTEIPGPGVDVVTTLSQ
ncbi:hypothetical protein [Alicyclobacillus sp. SO9]|nr:hypothetical protein [Alicyclobacillus sp. SO9]